MEYFLFWIILSFVVGFVGSSRKIGFAGAFFASILLSPLIGLIITLVSKNEEEERYKRKVLEVQTEQRETLNKLVTTKAHFKETKSITDELEKLKDLKDSGAITDHEFVKLKTRIIDKLSEDDNLNTTVEKSIQPESNSKNSEQIDTYKLNSLKRKLKDQELIIQIKDSNELMKISKEVHETNIDLHLNHKYRVIYSNS